MQTDLIQEARRQAEICNACRYCEGFCSVFPSLHAERAFSDGDITQLANLCHNCRGCYYACQYTAPHEFDLNLPAALAEVRRDSWQSHVWPAPVGERFHTNGMAITLVSVLGFALLFAVARWFGSSGGERFYAVISHGTMVAIFSIAFLMPFVSLLIGLRRYWRMIGGARIRFEHLRGALGSVTRMKNLEGGHGDGCNFEDEDRFTHARRHAHQAVMYGFLLCFAATSAGTVMHYVFDLHAPYGFWSLPKLLGVPGGILMVIGTLGLVALKRKAEPELGDVEARGGEMAFIWLLFAVAASGLALYGLGATSLMPLLVALHLGTVLSFFLLMPFTKMAHAPFRLAALVRDQQRILSEK